MASLPFSQIDSMARGAVPEAGRPASPTNLQLTVLPWEQATTSAFRSDWSALALSAAEPNPFFESWFLRPGLTQWGRHVDLACLHYEGALRGIWPLVHSGSYYSYPVPHLTGWLHANAFCGTPLVARGHERAFWRGLLEWADDASGSALFLHIPDLAEDGPLLAALGEVIREDGRSGAIVQREERAMLQSELSPETYFEQSMCSKKRKELRRQYRRLSEQGTVTFDRQLCDADIAQWIDQFLALEQRGWKGKEGSALACDARTESLFRESLSGAAACDRLERLTLSLDAKPIAMLANFITAPGAFSFKTAFDEGYARYSPGVLLQRENLTLLAREGIDWVDSCAAADHPMIERIWREKRSMVKVNVSIGGTIRSALFRQFLKAECGGEHEEIGA